MNKILALNGVEFEVITPRKNKLDYSNFEQAQRYNGKDLYTVYKRPSQVKLNIWRDWVNWRFDTPECTTIGVLNGNCNMFTIIGTCIIKGKYYIMRITKHHNYLIEVC